MKSRSAKDNKLAKRLAIGALALGCLTLIGAIGGITYAHYVSSESINRTVGTKRYLFLNVAWVEESSGHDWEYQNPGIYLFAYTKNQSGIDKYETFLASHKANGNYYFYVSNIYTHCRFARVAPEISWADVPAKILHKINADGDFTGIWNLTSEATLPTGGNNTNAKNTYTISGWESGSFPN